MAIKLPSFKFFANTDAKSRVFVVLAVIIGVSATVFFVYRYFFAGQNTTGASKVAAAPAGLQSVPGGQLSPEYYRTLVQANQQAAQQAQMTGGTAVPTLVNIPSPQQNAFQPPQQQSCTILCPNPEEANVTTDINDLVKSGKLSQKDADALLALTKRNASVDEYAAALDELVRQGKLTPEQARLLLEKYKKQHQNALLNESARAMDAMIKSGQLPLDVANQLLALQKNKATPAEYAEELNRLVAQGKISPQTAAQLLAQYTQQQAAEATKAGIFALKQLAKSGAITPDVADELAAMQAKNVPVDDYAAELQRLVAAGKITPAEAAKLLAEYKARRATLGGATGTLEALIQQAEMECQSDLKKLGGAANEKNLPASCQRLNQLRALAQQLMKLQANNASAGTYADELKRAVQAGLLSPETAASLLQYYQASVVPLNGLPIVQTNLPTTADFARLQQAIAAQPVAQNQPTNAGNQAQFAAAAAQAEQLSEQEHQQRVQALTAAMSTQAQSLITAWQPPKMAHQTGTPPTPPKPGVGANAGKGASTAGAGGANDALTVPETAPLIKSGTIMYAVLDTAVDSDYPDTPVMVTIVQGPFKGATLLGRLALAQGQDRVSLSFNLMNRNDWLKTKTVTAFAIDPDTARTVMASSVDHHYLMRYGSLFASSFLSGYAQGVQNAGTSTTGIFGTSTQNPQLSFGNNIAVALGQVGTNFTNVVQNYVNTPATVRINSGVGLGILFMADVT